MDSRRLTFVLLRTAVFFVVALVMTAAYGWPWFGVVAVALTGTASLMQLAGVLWLRRTEGEVPAKPRTNPAKPSS